MAVPKFKTSKSKKRKRRTQDKHKLEPRHLVSCGNCGLSTPPHAICDSCGHYPTRHKGGRKTRQVILKDEG